MRERILSLIDKITDEEKLERLYWFIVHLIER